MVSGEEVAAMKDALQEVGRIAEKAAHKFWNEATTAEDGLAVARALRAVVRAASPPEIPPDEEPICECSFPLREHRVGYSRSQCKFVLRGASQPGGTPIVPGEAPRLTPDEEALVNALRSVVGGSMTVLGRDGMAGLLRIIERLLRGRPEPEGERLTEAAIAELRRGDGTYYVAEERAFAPGISGEWPVVIKKPGDKNGRLVKRTFPGANGGTKNVD
jgi:hypothetical protein